MPQYMALLKTCHAMVNLIRRGKEWTPFIAARCIGVHLSLLAAFGSAPARINLSVASNCHQIANFRCLIPAGARRKAATCGTNQACRSPPTARPQNLGLRVHHDSGLRVSAPARMKLTGASTYHPGVRLRGWIHREYQLVDRLKLPPGWMVSGVGIGS